jgi:hypothetical protein
MAFPSLVLGAFFYCRDIILLELKIILDIINYRELHNLNRVLNLTQAVETKYNNIQLPLLSFAQFAFGTKKYQINNCGNFPINLNQFGSY